VITEEPRDSEDYVSGLRCSVCGRVNTGTAKFCNFCGAGLGGAPEAPLAPPVVEPDLQDELLHLMDESASLVDNGMPKMAKILVKVIAAKGLRAADMSIMGGSSDPFVIGQIVDRPETKFQTRFIPKNLNPEWNEEFEISADQAPGDLEFVVMDYDKNSSADLLGKVVLKKAAFAHPGGFHGELQLEGCGRGRTSTLEVRVHLLWFSPPPPVSREGSRLKVTIMRARGLRAADWALGGGKSDPFCTCEIEGVPELKVQTRHISKTLEPTWDEEHIIPIFERGQGLTFRVFDYDRGSSADLLGKVFLPTHEFDKDGGFEGDLRLIESGDAPDSMLTVKVEVLEPLLPDAPRVSQEGSRLRVTMISAKGLRAADWSLRGKGSSDPYCTCEVKGKPDLQVSTKHINKTLEPVWDEEHELPAYEHGDCLLFKVFDHDRGSSADLLGRASLLCRDFDREGGFEGDLILLESGTGPGATLKVRVEVLPPLMPDAPPVSIPGCRLQVTMKSAKNLRAADWSFRGKGSSDPYCVCEIEGKEELCAKTKHIKKTLDPAWNESHELPVYERGDSLVFKVYDYDRGSSSDLLGRVVLAGRDFDREGGFEGELRLLESGKGSKATLCVKVEVLPPLLPPAPPISEPGCTLTITVVGAKGLRAADWNGTSDAFCECMLRGKPETMFKTKTIPKSLTPMWCEEHEVDDYENGDCLEFKVFDYDMTSANDLLGRAILPCNAFDRQGGFQGELPLLGGGPGAKLQVSVVVVPSPYPEAEPISEPGCVLKLTLMSASNLRPADVAMLGAAKSDPYCVAQVRGKPGTKVQTKHITSTLDPVWKEEHEIHDYDRGECLEFSVWDYDVGSGADLLGKVTLVSRAFDCDGGFDGKLKLRNCGPDRLAYLHVRVEVLSGLLLPVAPPVSVCGSRVRVNVISARDLRAADFSLTGGKSDPYCVVNFKDKQEDGFQTAPIKKTLNPVWNTEFEFSDYESCDVLEFTVLDHDLIGKPDLLGKAFLAAGDFDREGGFSGELKLRQCGKGQKSKLRVQVEVLPPLRPPAPPISVPGSRLQVTIISGRGLRPADWNIRGTGKSDPFCTCTIVGKPNTQITTRHIKKTLSPVWDEEHELDDFERGDALEFRVMDHDMASAADLLGRVTLPSREFDREDGFDGELRLRECGMGRTATLNVRIRIVLPMQRAPPVSVPGSRLRVTVVRANSLRAADFDMRGASSDPFCRLEIKDKPASRRETRWLSRTLDPVWNEEFDIEDYCQGDGLDFTVFDYDRGSAADFLGRVSIPGTEFDREGGFSGTVKLKDCGRGRPATLTLRMQVLPPLREGGTVSEPGCSLRVHIRSAAGLSACAGTPDPFVECWLRGKKVGTIFKTLVHEQTLSPVWNETHSISHYVTGDRLEFAVMDQYVDDVDLLGKCSLEGMEFDTHGGFDGEMRLFETRTPGGTLSARVEVVPPQRLALFVKVLKLSLIGGDLEDKGVCCTMFPEGRDQSRLQTSFHAGGPEVIWDEEREMPFYVEGDKLVFELRGLGGEVHARGSLDYSAIRRPTGFFGEVPLADPSAVKGQRKGAVVARVLTLEQREKWLEAEAEQQRQRERKQEEEERKRREREEEERQRLQAEADERARKEAEKRAAAAAARRAEHLAREIVVSTLLWPSPDVLAQVQTTAGSTVLEFARKVGRIAKLPLCPRVRVDRQVPSDDELLLDASFCEVGAKISVEMCPAVLTCSKDGTAKIWNATHGVCEVTIGGHEAAIISACATSDLKWVITASADCTAKVWVVDGIMGTATLAWTLEGHKGPVTYAAFSSDVTMAVTASEDGTAKVWKMRNGNCVRTFEGHTGAVVCAAFTPDDKSIVTTGDDGVAKTWGVDSGRCEGIASGAKPPPPAHFAADGQLFLRLSPTEVEVRNMASGACLSVLRGHEDELTWVSFIALRAPQAVSFQLPETMSISGPNFTTPLNAGASLVLQGNSPTRSSSAPQRNRGEPALSKAELERRVRARRAAAGASTKNGRFA